MPVCDSPIRVFLPFYISLSNEVFQAITDCPSGWFVLIFKCSYEISHYIRFIAHHFIENLVW